MNNYEEYNYYLYTFIIIVIIIILLAILRVLANIAYYRKNWNDYRCKSYIMPVAHFVKPDISTKSNFNYCVKNDMVNVLQDYNRLHHEAAEAVENSLETIEKDIDNVENMVINEEKKLASAFNFLSSYFVKLLEPFVKTLSNFKSVTKKAHGTLGVLGYSMYTGVLSVRSFLGAFADVVVKFLRDLKIAMAGAAVAGGVEVAATMVVLYEVIFKNFDKIAKGLDSLNIKHKKAKKLKKHKHHHCFSSDTIIGNTNKRIIDLNISDRVDNDGNRVTFLMKCLKTDDMYVLNNVKVSAYHRVFYKDKYISVKDHPQAKKIEFDNIFVYCLGTSKKYFNIENELYLDWDDVETADSPGYTTGGFSYNTLVKLKDGTFMKIIEITVGTMLYGNNQVSGIICIEGKPIFENKTQDNKHFKSSYSVFTKNNPVIFRNNTGEKQLTYHLLTQSQTFIINDNIEVHDFDYEP